MISWHTLCSSHHRSSTALFSVSLHCTWIPLIPMLTSSKGLIRERYCVDWSLNHNNVCMLFLSLCCHCAIDMYLRFDSLQKTCLWTCFVVVVQWNLRTTDALGAGLLSFVERLSLSRRLVLSKLAPRPRYVWLASSPGFPVWVRLLHCVQPKPR